MFELILPSLVVLCVVIYFLNQHINKLTNRIDTEANIDKSKLYSAFSNIIQEKIRNIRLDIDSSQTSTNARFKLIDENDLTNSLEILSDMIRNLVFLETINIKKQNPQEIESKLFGILNELDNFLNQKMQDGENISNEIRDELFSEYENLQKLLFQI